MTVKPNLPVTPPSKSPSPYRKAKSKHSQQQKAKPSSGATSSDETRLQMLDRVEITRDQKDGQLRKEMRGTILNVLTGGPKKAFCVEIIRPSIVETVAESDVRQIDD